MIPTNKEMRQVLDRRHGEALQEKIASAHVAICGLGGLGSHIATALARAGIGRLHLIDFDRVDLSNLNRQQYNVNQIGRYKTEALSENLKQMAPYCEVVTDTVCMTKERIPHLLKEDEIICEAFDGAEAKAMLVEGVLERFPQKYVVASSGMAGIGSANTIQTRKVSKHFYLCGDGMSDISDGLGLISSRVMICAAHQAHMVLRLISGEIDP